MIAEFNMGRLLYHWDDPRVGPFVEALDRVYALAARAPGFVWSMPPDELAMVQFDRSGPLKGDPRIAATLSVWQSVAALKAFAHDGVHGAFLRRSHAWFEVHDGPRMVLWSIPEGCRPTVAEGVERLNALGRDGPSAFAYDWAYGLALEQARPSSRPEAVAEGAAE